MWGLVGMSELEIGIIPRGLDALTYSGQLSVICPLPGAKRGGPPAFFRLANATAICRLARYNPRQLVTWGQRQSSMRIDRLPIRVISV